MVTTEVTTTGQANILLIDVIIKISKRWGTAFQKRYQLVAIDLSTISTTLDLTHIFLSLQGRAGDLSLKTAHLIFLPSELEDGASRGRDGAVRP